MPVVADEQVGRVAIGKGEDMPVCLFFFVLFCFVFFVFFVFCFFVFFIIIYFG